jgi:hypothetical protein
MPLFLLTREGILRLKGGGTAFFSTPEAFVEDRPLYTRLLGALQRAGAGRGSYVGLGPGLALLRLQAFPALQGFSLEEAVLAEAEQSPLFSTEELTSDYLLASPEDERRVRVLYGAIPKNAASLLNRLRPSHIEPLPLLLWRYALEKSQGGSLLVVESLCHSVALFERGVLTGFRYLSLPAGEGTPELSEEIRRSLALFGHIEPVDEAWLLGLPEPPRLPPGLAAKRVTQAAPLDLESFVNVPGPTLNLKPRRRALGEGLPKEAQLAVFLSALLFVLGFLGQSLLGQLSRQELRRSEVLRQEVNRLSSQLFQPARPQGLGLGEILQVAAERPQSLWLTRLEASEKLIALEGKALDPYAPLLLARRLGGRLGPLGSERVGEGSIYTWEVEVAKAQAR